MRLLVVDDDPGHLELLSRALGDGRPHVTIARAADRGEFEDAIQTREFDCVIIDYNLGSCCADELLRDLREVRPDCPAIVVSGSNRQDIVVCSLRHGCVDFVHKDDALEPGVLWERVDVVISEWQRRKIERRTQERRTQRLLEMAESDPLTGLANRRAIHRLLQGEGEDAPMSDQAGHWPDSSGPHRRHTQDRRGTSAVILFDLDNFKAINDTHGHEFGDEVLRGTAALLRRSVNPGDIACRWGGEEFLVLRPNSELAQAVSFAEAFRFDLQATPFHAGGKLVSVTSSFGVVCVHSAELSFNAIARADQALYRAKRRGRNRICTWESVAFECLMRDIAGASPAERLRNTLRRTEGDLGPTQREHLNDHSFRVSETAVCIGNRLGLQRQELERLRLAGLCHDLGKMIVPEQILAKPGRLTREEVVLMDLHAEDGADIIHLLGADNETTSYVRLHHRRFDESNGSPIPLGARVLNVADAFVAMTSNRPYQSARSDHEAFSELMRQSGKQFDPEVVEAAVSSLKSHALAVSI